MAPTQPSGCLKASAACRRACRSDLAVAVRLRPQLSLTDDCRLFRRQRWQLIFYAFALCLLRLAIVGIIIARGSKRHQDVGPNQRAQSAHTSSIVAGSIGGNHVQMSCYRKTQHSCRRAPRPRRRSRQCPRWPRAISEGLGCQPVGRSAGESQDDEKRFRHYRIFVIVSAQSLALTCSSSSLEQDQF